MESATDWESCTIARLASTRANGSVTCAAAEEWNATQTETDTKANFSRANPTVKASTRGRMARFTRVNGAVVSKKAKASGRASMVTHISVSGASPKPQATVFTCGRMETGTRVNGRIALNTVKEQIYLPMEIVSQVPMSWASQKVKANISGKT